MILMGGGGWGARRGGRVISLSMRRSYDRPRHYSSEDNAMTLTAGRFWLTATDPESKLASYL